MTNLEKFYKLALNMLSNPIRNIRYCLSKIEKISIKIQNDKLSFYPNLSERYFEYYSYYYDDLIYFIGENDPVNMDDLIERLKVCGCESLLDGIE